MSSPEKKINDLLDRIRQENNNTRNQSSPVIKPPVSRNNRPSGLPLDANARSPNMRQRPQVLTFTPKIKPNDYLETEGKLREIMRISGMININGRTHKTDIKDMDHLEELGNGTCGHVIKMKHRPSGEIIAVKQMRRSGNSEESKRIIMDIEVVLKSHDCKYIVKCLGCFITEPEVWICMELMSTCFDKLLKRLKEPIPENVLGKVTVATVEALSYLKDKHGVIHRDVKPSNILLDARGNVKLCDFGISGRLVDSMAKTRSAGCAAYMAPERIEPDPASPDYDVRADVWSLGITLVELATGVFPYKDCHSDFEVLTKVIENDPPTLPEDKEFSPEFRRFVSCCLIKEKKQRPKYVQLKNEPFIKKYETADVNVGEWYSTAIQQADTKVATSRVPSLLPTSRRPDHHDQINQKLTNGTSTYDPPKSPPSNNPFTADVRSQHISRLSTFHNNTTAVNNQRSNPYQSHQEFARKPSAFPPSYPFYHQNSSPETTNPFTEMKYNSQRRLQDGVTGSPYLQKRPSSESRWRSSSGSPLPVRNCLQSNQDLQYNHGNTSPIVLQRFIHQQKQQQLQRDVEEGKKSATFIQLQLSSDRSGNTSRNQSPDPPPRLNRSVSGEQSPLALRRIYLESSSGSPGHSRRNISPAPPPPPPRKLAGSISVPGSPQHLRAKFHYTPEPQRRIYHNSDAS